MAVIQESRLSPKSKNPCIQNYTTVRKDRSHGQGGGLPIFVHRSITLSNQPSSPASLSDPHMEELSIKAELGNTKLIISNVYIPPTRFCSNGYHSSIEHLLTTPDTLILGDFTRTIRHGTLDRPIQEEERCQTQSTDLIMIFSTGTTPQEFRQILNRVSQMSH